MMGKIKSRQTIVIFALMIMFAAFSISFAQKTKTKEAEIIFGEYGEVTVKDLFQKRDMTSYEQGGNYDCREYVFKGKRGECDKQKFREFIWKNWSDKKSAYVRITENSLDAGATRHFFIEPDKKGNRTIVCRMVRWHALPGGNEILDFPTIYSVEQIEDKANKEKWKLMFKNKSGQLVFEY